MSILGGALIGAGTSILGNVFGKSSQDKANETNLKIAQMNNDFNKAEAEKNRQFQSTFANDMFNKTNEYNSASNKRKRIEEAGLNPYRTMTGDVSGTASSTPASGSQASSSGNPLMQAYTPKFDTMSDTLQSLAQSSNLFSQKKKTDIQNTLEADRLKSEIDKNIGGTNFAKLSPAAQEFEKMTGLKASQIQLSSMDQTLSNMRYAGDLQKAQTSTVLLDAQSKEILNKYLDQGQQIELNMKATMLHNAVLEGQLSPIKAKAMIAETLMVNARTRGLKINNAVANNTAQGLIDATNASNSYEKSYYNQGTKFGANMFNMDYNSKAYHTNALKYGSKTSALDYKTYGIRNAIDYTGRLFQGAGNVVGSFNDYKRMKHQTRDDY